jgi:hypothetical protein
LPDDQGHVSCLLVGQRNQHLETIKSYTWTKFTRIKPTFWILKENVFKNRKKPIKAIGIKKIVKKSTFRQDTLLDIRELCRMDNFLTLFIFKNNDISNRRKMFSDFNL